ncbi:hypothetical protein E3N88_26048 [Mikania micrantha]|uniref:Uncharacterized protein n=1 Tax=Mikania micrantha TaxID=192012 RepID=A0A5N6N6G5_9ASTR|nr:hypothetical protein E3N88_26048 [Mikania micrantha]
MSSHSMESCPPIPSNLHFKLTVNFVLPHDAKLSETEDIMALDQLVQAIGDLLYCLGAGLYEWQGTYYEEQSNRSEIDGNHVGNGCKQNTRICKNLLSGMGLETMLRVDFTYNIRFMYTLST